MFRKISNRDGVQIRAGRMLAEDKLSDSEIALQCRITRRTLIRWKREPAFQRIIDAQLTLSSQHAETELFRERQYLIAGLDACWENMKQIIRIRAKSPEMKGVPGGQTGLLRRKGQARGVANYELDRPLLMEMRKLEVEASKLLGQW